MSINRYWTPQRKAQVVHAVKRGDLSLGRASEVHLVPAEEIARWIELHDRYGPEGLRITHKPGRAVPA